MFTEFDFTPGSTVLLKSAKRANYFFDGWYRDEALTKKVTSVGTMDAADVTLYAKWLPIEAPRVKAAATASTIYLSWAACKNATHYRVYEYNLSTGKYKFLANTTAKSHLITGKKPGMQYAYLVRSYYKEKSGREIISSFGATDRVQVYTLCASPQVTTVLNGNLLKLKWKPIQGAVSYAVYRYDAKEKRYYSIASTGNTSYLVKNLPRGQSYFLVTAKNYQGKANRHTAQDLVSVNVK